MKTNLTRFDIKSLLLGTVSGVGLMLCVGAATTPASRPNWEYKVVQGMTFGNESKLEDGINAQAANGWEFVSSSPSVPQWGFAVMRREKK